MRHRLLVVVLMPIVVVLAITSWLGESADAAYWRLYRFVWRGE